MKIMDDNLKKLESQFLNLGREGYILPRLVTKETLASAFYSADKMVSALQDSFEKLSDSDKLSVFHQHLIWAIFEFKQKEYYKNLKDRLKAYFSKIYGNAEQMEQIFQCFEQGLYYPCICGVVPLAEKLLFNIDRPTDTAHDRLLRAKVKKLLGVENNDRENILLKANLTGYVQFLYKSSSFSDVEPKNINRNWLLHGRTNRTVSEDDCLNVFILLDILVELNEKIEATT